MYSIILIIYIHIYSCFEYLKEINNYKKNILLVIILYNKLLI